MFYPYLFQSPGSLILYLILTTIVVVGILQIFTEIKSRNTNTMIFSAQLTPLGLAATALGVIRVLNGVQVAFRDSEISGERSSGIELTGIDTVIPYVILGLTCLFLAGMFDFTRQVVSNYYSRRKQN